jgi:anti-sigma regulatory factor (Ser/Thr protein kinase)
VVPTDERASGSVRAASLRLELERNAEAPAIARAAVRGLCERSRVSASSCQTLLLLVSEIVTNAVVHSDAPASRPIAFSARARRGRVHVEVADGGHGFHPRSAHSPSGGWGLRLVQKEAARWGIDTERGTTVWFDLRVDG